jgi:hypothetical protein
MNEAAIFIIPCAIITYGVLFGYKKTVSDFHDREE